MSIITHGPALFRGIACLALLVGLHTTATAAGVAVFKDQPYHKDAHAEPIIYTSILPSAPIQMRFMVGSKEVAYDRSKIVGWVEVPELPTSLSPAQVEAVKKVLAEIQAFSARYAKTSEILAPYINQYTQVVQRLENGDARSGGRWITKTELASMQAAETARREEMERKEKALAEQMKIRRQEEEAYAAAQRAKGLEQYGKEWLPKAEAEKRKKKDWQTAEVLETIRDRSVIKARYEVFQVTDDLVLIRPAEGGGFKRSSLNNEVAALFGSAEGTVAEGDIYTGDLYWCGTYSYPSKGGETLTVHAYSLIAEDAFSRLHAILFESPNPDDSSGKANGRTGKPDTAATSGKKGGDDLPEPIRNAKSTGSGFFIGKDGHFVTNAHVVDDAETVFILHEGVKLPAAIVHIGKVADLALLKVDKAVPGFELPEQDAEPGTDVFAIGYPMPSLQGIDPKVTKGVISGVKGIGNDDTKYQIDAAIQPGNSGGPLCDSGGRLVGVIVETLSSTYVLRTKGIVPQNVNYAIKASELAAFLRSRSIKPAASPSTVQNTSFGLKPSIAKTGLVIVE